MLTWPWWHFKNKIIESIGITPVINHTPRWILINGSNIPCTNTGKQTKRDRVDKNSFSTLHFAIFLQYSPLHPHPTLLFPDVFLTNSHLYTWDSHPTFSVNINNIFPVRWSMYTTYTRNWIHNVSVSSSFSR